MILLRILNGANRVANCFIICVVAALLPPYANPPGTLLLNPEIELVATTWLRCAALWRFLFPLSSNSKNATIVKNVAAVFTV